MLPRTEFVLLVSLQRQVWPWLDGWLERIHA
jgi:hypothetical protein